MSLRVTIRWPRARWAHSGLLLWLLLSPCASVGAQDDDLGDLDDLDDVEAVGHQGKRGDSRAASDTQVSDSQDEPNETDETEAEAPEPEIEAAQAGPSVVIEPYAGAGISTRSISMPSSVGVLKLQPGVVPAAEVGLRVVVWPVADFSVVVNLVFQSALGFTVTEHPPLALEKQVRAHSERVALDVAPRWRLGIVHLAVPVGATVRTFWPEVHTSQTPGYSLVGPHVRLELTLQLAESLSLRVSPELHYIVFTDQALRHAGVSSQGPALGGDASIDLRLSRVWALGINYRESHALLSTTRSGFTFQDVERYLTLRAVGSF